MEERLQNDDNEADTDGSHALLRRAVTHTHTSSSDSESSSVSEVTEGNQAPDVHICQPEQNNATRSWFSILMTRRNEVFVIGTLLFSLISTGFQIFGTALSHGRLAQRGPRPPSRFMGVDSPVLDLYNGNDVEPHLLLKRGEIVFVFYYAPWCAECVDLRHEFDVLARHFSPQVQFFAVNCWDPGGRCKQLYKMYTYPVIQLYPGTAQGFYYTGLHSSDYMFRFLELVLNPLIQLQSVSAVENFVQSSDAAVVAFFDFRQYRNPLGYESFYLTALKSLEKEAVHSNVRFAVITDLNVAQPYNMTNNELRLYQVTEDAHLTYPTDHEFKSRSIVNWVYSNLKLAVRWAGGTGDKNDQLDQLTGSQPTVILFTPRMPLLDSGAVFDQFREVALDYRDCNHSTRISQQIERSILVRNNRLRLLKRTLHRCRNSVREQRQFAACCEAIVDESHAYMNAARNICDVCLSHLGNGGGPFDKNRRPAVLQLAHHVNSLGSVDCSALLTSRRDLGAGELVRYCCDRPLSRTPRSSRLTRMSTCARDAYNCENYTPGRGALHGECTKLHLAKLKHYDLRRLEKQMPSALPSLRHVTGLACKTNRTLQFVAVDSLHHRALADRLGIQLHSESKTKLVIVDREYEVQHVLEHSGDLRDIEIAQFVQNFTDNKLRDYLRTQRDAESYRGTSVFANSSFEDYVYVQNVTTLSFETIVLNKDKDVVVMLYAPWCGPCKVLYPTYFTLAYYFRNAPNLVFAQFDASVNDLPWQYTVDNYPTIMFFPAHKKAETVVFPQHLPLNVPNLVAFVLAYAGTSLRLNLALSACSPSCVERNKARAILRMAEVRSELRVLKARIRMAETQLDLVNPVIPDRPLLETYVELLWKLLHKKQMQRMGLKNLLTVLSQYRRLAAAPQQWRDMVQKSLGIGVM